MHSAWQPLICKDVVSQILSSATSFLQSCHFGEFSVRRRGFRNQSLGSAYNIRMGIKRLPRMLCTHDRGILAPPARIRQSQGFAFAFSELLSFLLPPTRAGVMDQPWVRRKRAGGLPERSHFGSGHLPPECLLEKASLRLMPRNCCLLLLGVKVPFPSLLCLPRIWELCWLWVPAVCCLLWVRWWYTALVSWNLKCQRDRGQEGSTGSGSEFTGENSTYSSFLCLQAVFSQTTSAFWVRPFSQLEKTADVSV